MTTPQTLRTMLKYKRTANSRTEAMFVRRYLDTVPGMQEDAYGNRMLLHPTSRVIIACHTDTVHRTQGYQHIAETDGMIYLPQSSRSNCLGADCTAGIYAALRMIEAEVPVSYMFHRNEEIGGLGSRWIANIQADWISRYSHVVSLDRRGTNDIITHQVGERTASDAFAGELADALDMAHKPAIGIFTDSANYAHLVPECTNISVGYYNEHTPDEHLDTLYLESLITKLCDVDWNSLGVYRYPRDTSDLYDEQAIDQEITPYDYPQRPR